MPNPAASPSETICLIIRRPDERTRVCHWLDEAGITCHAAADAVSGLELIHLHRPPVVLSDWTSSTIDALQVCREVRAHPELAATYFIVSAARGGRRARTLALESGVDDYLAKPIDPRELIARVRVGLRLAELQARLVQAAITDGLTGLYNHDHFNRVLERELNRARRYGQPLALLMLDLDYFKAVNDAFGHLVGNQVLEAVAGVLRGCVRDVDTVARFGGEEFTIITPAAALDDALVMARRIVALLPRAVRLDAVHGHPITASIGVAGSEDLRVKTAADLLNLADKALYVAKHRGRNQVVGAGELPPDGAQGTPVSLVQIEDVEALRKRVVVMSVQAKEVYLQSITALVQAMEEKDPYTARHALNVAHYSEQLAQQLGGSAAFVRSVRYAALLHDLGKIGIPDRILTKPDALTALERSVMDQVPYISTRIVEPLRILDAEIAIIRHQREFYDGSGAPAGLAGVHIPLGARILLVADAFDAMTTDRLYRPLRSVPAALAEIQHLAGRQFDPRVVTALRQVLDAQQSAWQERIDETRTVVAQ